MAGARGGQDVPAPDPVPGAADLLDNPDGDDGAQVQDDGAEVAPDIDGVDEDRR